MVFGLPSLFGGGSAPQGYICGTCEVLRDVADGWPAACYGLTQTNLTTVEQCSRACCDDNLCQVWQFGESGCMMGSGHDCRGVRTDTYVVTAGQRITHGQTYTVPPEQGVDKTPSGGAKSWCSGLDYVSFTQATSYAADEHPQRCRELCMSDSTCAVWQYGGGYCYFGNSTDCSTKSSEAQGMVDGGRVERTCETHWADSQWFPFVILLAAALACCFLLLLFYVFYTLCRTEKKEGARTRGVKVAPREEKEEPAQYAYAPQPSQPYGYAPVAAATYAAPQQYAYQQPVQYAVPQQYAYAQQQQYAYAQPAQYAQYGDLPRSVSREPMMAFTPPGSHVPPPMQYYVDDGRPHE